MLREVVETILNFQNYESFRYAVATNGFYDANVYQKCAHILQRTNLVDSQSILSFLEFASAVEKISKENADEEEMLGEVPDEFMDPLMCTIMKDPVTLPTSGYVVDRSTINQHLLNDESDPFTRAPLTVDQLVPNEELKARILSWLADKSPSH